ncbi:unnamed protein product, partial [Prunus brigantina]
VLWFDYILQIQRLSKQQGEGNCIYAEELFNEHKDQFSPI